MKWLAGVLCLVVMLTGCGEKNRELEKALELRSKLLSAEEVSFDVQITADYGDKVHTFSMACKGDSLGNVVFSVTEPESIRGIAGNLGQEGGKLTFDDTALQFDLMADGQISPIAAPWILLKTLRSGFLTSAGTEGDVVRLTIDDSYDDDALTLDIWLGDDDLPGRAEILHDGRKILSLDVNNLRLG